MARTTWTKHMAIIIGAILLCSINFIDQQIYGYSPVFWALLGGFLGYLTRRIRHQESTLQKLGSVVYDLQQQLKTNEPPSTDWVKRHEITLEELECAVKEIQQRLNQTTPEPASEVSDVAAAEQNVMGDTSGISVKSTPPAMPEALFNIKTVTLVETPPEISIPDESAGTATPDGIEAQIQQTEEKIPKRGRITGKITDHAAERTEKRISSQEPSRLEQIFSTVGSDTITWLRHFFLGGNLLVKIGSLVFFLGLSFLLRYVASSGLLPVELRYAAVAAAGIGLLAFGWHLREKRPAYALVLQGVSIGVLYLTLFASMKIHDLMPIIPGFGLMVLVCITAAILAVRQNALSLAVAGSLGGFATPVLLSSGSGSHIALFSYLLLLNVGIACIAWFRAWRVLNMLGFFATFGLFYVWVSNAFMIEHWGSAEAFLWAFFVLFTGILLRTSQHLRLMPEEEPENDARRDTVIWNTKKRADMIDGSLTFALPLAAFGIHIAMSHGMEFAGAFAALGMGTFYLLLTAVLKKCWGNSSLLLNEAFLSLGVVFATLAIPLALDPHWTTASWALEAAGIYWVGLRQHRPLARGFATLLLIGAIISFLRTLEMSVAPEIIWLQGSALGALLIFAASLFIYLLATRFASAYTSAFEKKYGYWAALIAIVFFALLPAQLLSRDNTVPVWALQGMLIIYLSLRDNLKQGLWSGFILQFLSGAVFALNLEVDNFGDAPLTQGWHGLFVALIIGGALLFGYRILTRNAQHDDKTSAAQGLSLFAVLALIGALVFFNLTPLFIFPLMQILPGWAVSACVALALSQNLGEKWRTVILFFTIALIIVSSAIFIIQTNFEEMLYVSQEPAFWHQQWWTMLIFSLAGFASAWFLFCGNRRQPENAPALPDSVLFVWGALWWYSAWSMELYRLCSASTAISWLVLVSSLTTLIWLSSKHFTTWQIPLLATFSHLPLCAALLLAFLAQGEPPFFHLFGVTWAIGVLAHFLILYNHDKRPSRTCLHSWHMIGLWWLLILSSSELCWQMANIGDEYSAWPKLGWAIFPLAYLWCAALWLQREKLRFWPLSIHQKTYCTDAALPVAGYMVLWVLFGNIASSGEALPLPYIPIINPLEIAFIASLLALFFWGRQQHAQSFLIRQTPWGIGLLTLCCLTGAVFRAVHHLTGLPWNFDILTHSMILQAGLSITWGLAACALMIVANKKTWRLTWISGSILMALVVFKLFVVELSHSNTLERIVSFIVVGILLLGLGYFAPIPPRKTERSSQ